MKKTIYVVRGLPDESHEDFSKRILSLADQLHTQNQILKAKVTFTQIKPPLFSIIPFKKSNVAVFSVVNDKDELFSPLIDEVGLSGAYDVDEALPVAYHKNWEDLTLTPGVCLLTLFKQKKSISHQIFLDRWHNGHTPLSLKIHPLWNYNRNVVLEKLTPESELWDGIVEEQFKTTTDLLNPIKFFGHPLIMPYRMWEVYTDTKRFLDYPSIEPYFAQELHIKS